MRAFEFGNPEADLVLVQMVGDHDLSYIAGEIALIRQQSPKDFRFLALQVDNWNADLSPWEAPAVFGNEGFGSGAAQTLEYLQDICSDTSKTYILGGYSLSALFALWAASRTSLFSGVAAASPSMWFPGFLDHMRANPLHCGMAYLSLGDKEEKTRNPVMATVAKCIRTAHTILTEQGITSTLEWNPGNHFRDADQRTAKAFAWVMNQI